MLYRPFSPFFDCQPAASILSKMLLSVRLGTFDSIYPAELASGGLMCGSRPMVKIW